MDHVAILSKSRKLLPKILNGTKTIESRWYVNKIAPWDRIKTGDTVYFKNSGENVTAKAGVSKVLQYANLTEPKIQEILKEYGVRIGIDPSEFNNRAKAKSQNKNYAILIFLRDVKSIKPLKINKTGFGASCAWMCVGNINNPKPQKF